MDSPAPASPRRRIGDYEVLAPIKSGGMGEVLLGRRRGAHDFHRLVAIKTIRGEYRGSGHLRDMFLDEARLTARISHPAVAHVYDFGEEAGLLYLVMEYVAGVSLLEVVRRGPPQNVVAAIMAQVCRGLHAAHELRGQRGESLEVVHRDISPGNLMLTFDGAAKIIDFGIAFARERRVQETEIGELKGKPPYMAPEQLKGESVDRRADIWACGVVLHELLTGQRLFSGKDAFQVAHQITSGERTPPSALVAGIAPGFDDIVARAVKVDPDHRYPTAAAMGTDLEALAAELEGPDPLAYSRETFAAEREAAAEHITLITGRWDTQPHGRPSGVATLVEAAGDDAPGAPEATMVDRGRRKGPRWWVIGGTAAAALAGAMAAKMLMVTGEPSRADGAGAVPSPAPRPEPAVMVEAPPMDAGVAGADAGRLDTAVTADAGGASSQPTGRRNRSPRPGSRGPRIDAGRRGAAPVPDSEPAEPGTVRVLSRVDAQIFVDGQLRGSGNLSLRLPPGRYRIEARDPISARVLVSGEVTVGSGTTEVFKVQPPR